MKELTVERAGPLALVQDGGRFGVRHLGVTQGGAMDPVSMGWANWLLGNDPGAAALEISLGGLTLRAGADGWLALSGADLDARLDDEPLSRNAAFAIRAGQRLSFGHPVKGVRAYLAVAGGIAGSPTLGSLACVVREGLGGADGEGRALAQGDVIRWQGDTDSPRQLPNEIRMPLDMPPELALIQGAQSDYFAAASLFDAFNSDWQVDSRADRMGIRLRGPQLDCRLSGMVSEGIPLGAVQVPADGQPIVLMNDRQTVGGYPRLGALSPLACARLAQCAPGERVRMLPTTPERAREAWRRQLKCW
ncbi:5-oxoprolinase subunit C family protein [Kushneria aurantia]|uniref:Biotin-dependent carboxyltransferase family protein n=1 Tax=Kushneria aurantia TaxID=504092 RepID=A0ABV6FZ30_9GAMM|nr:biotin-dependent carboxyltransferase family protein [Kushneria aurantia]